MTKEECREQIQEDVIAYMEPLLDREYEFTSDNVDDLCQIVVDNFKKLEESVLRCSSLEQLLDAIYEQYPEGASTMPSKLEEAVTNTLYELDGLEN